MYSQIVLKEVDSVEITSLVDNTIDLNSIITNKEAHKVREWTRNRMGIDWTKKYFGLPFAEHGFSLIIEIFSQKNHHTILFDAGLSPDGIVKNSKRLRIDLSKV